MSWKFNPLALMFDVMLATGLFFMPGIWWAKLMVFMAILMSVNMQWR